jgi:peptide/nickel transport system ATP-binding protein
LLVCAIERTRRGCRWKQDIGLGVICTPSGHPAESLLRPAIADRERLKEEKKMSERVNGNGVLLEVNGLRKYFPIQRGFFKRAVGYVKAVDDITFYIREGETLGLVGESGCGKTTTGRCIVRAIDPTDGEILLKARDGEQVNMREVDKADLKRLRQEIQMIFQDPYSSLNPRMTLLQIVGEPLVVHRVARGRELEDRVAQLLRVVGLRPEYMRRYPHAFSGGQRQRIGLARALALNPRFIVADEPVSALDVSIQAQILNLLQDLQGQFDLTYLFIAHDLSVIEHISDRVAVMYVGKLVESAETEELYMNPQHPYTEALMSAVPKPDPRLRTGRIVLAGEVADPANPPSGCYFHPRCRYAQEVCEVEGPELREISEEHFVSCHLAEELQLEGVA